MSSVRCAIYTRKSSEEGLDQSFNSLQAQREACEAFVRSQKSEGWRILPEVYDDGGISGGTLERPALERMLADVDAGRIDLIVVYKVDRLTRSLADFAKLVERLEARNVSFVSVTQQFNTSTSMGRLTLNVLLSFAQFEREVTGERIRDKIAASKAKGMWMGGSPPLGYDVGPDGLVVNAEEAASVRLVFATYLKLRSVRALGEELDRLGLRSKRRKDRSGRCSGGVRLRRGALYHMLANPIYVGRIRHRDQIHEGQHEAIIDEATFAETQELLASQRVERKRRANAKVSSPLAGRIFDETGDRLAPTHAAKKGVRYRYYVSQRLIEGEGGPSEGWRLPAKELEARVVEAIVGSPEVVRLRQRLGRPDELAPERVLRAVERVELAPGRMVIRLSVREAFGEVVGAGGECLKIVAPFVQRRRGVEQKLVIDEGKPGAPDLTLVKLVHRATVWVERLKAGASITEIAKDEGVLPPFVTQRVHLGLLSPRIVEAIVEGRLPAEVTAQLFILRAIRMNWRDQNSLYFQ